MKSQYYLEQVHTENITMQKKLSLATMGLGLALLVYMITVEDEPGALPLAMIVLGSVWHFVARARLRSRGEAAR
jgi:hypothetical protein